MADDLKTIVQRMIDAGESEENIQTVIQHFKAQPQTPPKPAMADAPTTGKLRGQLLRNAGDDAVTTLGGIPDALTQVVQHPIDSLTAIPVGMLQNIAAFAKDPVGRLYEHPLNTALDLAGAGGAVNAAEEGLNAALRAPVKIRNARMLDRVERYAPNVSGYSAADAGSTQAVPSVAARTILEADPSTAVNPAVESGRDWHSGITDPKEKAAAAALHRYDMEMDANYRRRISDPRGSVPIGMLLNPSSALRQGAQMLLNKAMPSLSTLKTGADVLGNAALISREAPPQTYKDALIQMLTGGGQ